MKQFLIILFLLTTLTVYSQTWKIPAIYSTSIAFNAIGDGLKDSGQKDLGHVFNAASIGLVVMSPLIYDYQKDQWWVYPLSYMFLRIAIFDWAYNWTRGLPYNYIGNTSIWDKGMQALDPPDGFAMGRVVALTVGISLPINSLKYENTCKKNKR